MVDMEAKGSKPKDSWDLSLESRIAIVIKVKGYAFDKDDKAIDKALKSSEIPGDPGDSDEKRKNTSWKTVTCRDTNGTKMNMMKPDRTVQYG